MAKPKTMQASIKQPTFADCDVAGWWDETDGGAWTPGVETLDCDLGSDIPEFMERVRDWRRIQSDPDEAQARKDYASHAARYLAGIFPNARVNAEAYGEAAGEELGRYSADIVKAVAERARRTSKTLPSIAQLLEWARTDSERRNAQYDALQRAMHDYEAAIRRGQEQAREVIEKGGLADRLTPETLAQFHRGLTFHSIGIKPRPPGEVADGWAFPDYAAKADALYRLVIRGHEGATDWLAEAARESERLHSVVDAANEWRGHTNAWQEFMFECRDRLTALLREAGR